MLCVLAVLLLGVLTTTSFLASFLRHGSHLCNQGFVPREELLQVNQRDKIQWYVWSCVLETAMNVDLRIHRPAHMTEALQRTELVPLRALCVVYLE